MYVCPRLSLGPLLSVGILAVEPAGALDRGAVALRLQAPLVRGPAGLGRHALALRRGDRGPEQGGQPGPGRLAVGELAAVLRGSHGETPPASLPARRSAALVRAHSGSADDRSTSKESSTRLSAVLTDWPPGPDDREKRSCSSLP